MSSLTSMCVPSPTAAGHRCTLNAPPKRSFLSFNKLSGTLPLSLARLQLLSLFSATDNSLRGGIDAFAGATELTSLQLTNNLLTGSLPTFSGSTKLYQFLVAHNQFSGTLPAELGSLTRMQLLTIEVNNLTGTMPLSFAALQPTLHTFTAQRSGLCGSAPLLPTDGQLPPCAVVPPGGGDLSSSRDVAVGVTLGLVAAAVAATAAVVRRRRRRRAASVDAAALAEKLLREVSSEESLLGWKADAADVRLLRVVGSGGFGTVYAATWNGSLVAAKVFKLQGMVVLRAGSAATASPPADGGTSAGGFSWLANSFGSLSSLESISNELTFLSQLRHPNIVTVYAFVSRPPMMLMELAVHGSLHKLLRAQTLGSLAWPARLDILTGVASGVEYLHRQSPPVIHLDLKCANVLLDGGLAPRVSDFGLSTLPVAERTRVGGTPTFMAPEVALEQLIDNWQAIDSYGFGRIAHEVAHVNTSLADDGSYFTRRDALPPLPHGREVDARTRASFAVVTAAHVPPPLAEIIADCVAILPDTRPSMTQLRERLQALGGGAGAVEGAELDAAQSAALLAAAAMRQSYDESHSPPSSA